MEMKYLANLHRGPLLGVFAIAATLVGCGGNGSASTTSASGASSAITSGTQQPPVAPPASSSSNATLSWTAPTENTDGSVLVNLHGYVIHYGTVANDLTSSITISNPGVTTYVVDNLAYSSHPFYVFEAASKFWLEDGIPSINMEFEHPDISSIWLETNQVQTDRIILKAFGPGGLSPQRVLAAFRQAYPGKKDSIEQALTIDWTKDKFAPACEMEPFPIGEMHKFWPEIMLPDAVRLAAEV